MGLVISRFRRKKSTGETLAALDSQIKSIEQYGRSTEQQRRKVVKNLVIVSVGLYVIAVLLFYIYFRPSSWRDGVFYSIPLLISPILIILLRNVIAKYYDWKLRRNKGKLSNMRAEKKRILEEVMDKETYKVAKDLLDKYGNTEMEKPLLQVVKASTPLSAPSTPARPLISSLVSATPGQLRQRQSGPPLPLGMPTPQRNMLPIAATPNQLTPLMADQLPRPIMSASGGGAFDRLVDYLIGDGPGNRFALICSSCKGHNGMALAEEFEYLSFKCAYCRHLNPSRKTRPRPPVLMNTPIHTDTSDHKSSTDNSDVEDSPIKRSLTSLNNTSLSQHSPPSAPPSSCDEKERETDTTANDSQHMSVDEDHYEPDVVDEPKADVDKKED